MSSDPRDVSPSTRSNPREVGSLVFSTMLGAWTLDTLEAWTCQTLDTLNISTSQHSKTHRRAEYRFSAPRHRHIGHGDAQLTTRGPGASAAAAPRHARHSCYDHDSGAADSERLKRARISHLISQPVCGQPRYRCQYQYHYSCTYRYNNVLLVHDLDAGRRRDATRGPGAPGTSSSSFELLDDD